MWSAELKGKELNSGVLKVTVEFTNGTDVISETIDLTGGSADVLARKVKGRINTLEATDVLAANLELGPVPAPAENSDNTVFQKAVRTLEKFKRAVQLGIIKETDPTFTDAQNAVKAAAVDPAVIELL